MSSDPTRGRRGGERHPVGQGRAGQGVPPAQLWWGGRSWRCCSAQHRSQSSQERPSPPRPVDPGVAAVGAGLGVWHRRLVAGAARRRTGGTGWGTAGDTCPDAGSGGETRTHNPLINSQMLCRLSYPGNVPPRPDRGLGRPGVPEEISRSPGPPGSQVHAGANRGTMAAVKLRIAAAAAFAAGFALGIPGPGGPASGSWPPTARPPGPAAAGRSGAARQGPGRGGARRGAGPRRRRGAGWAGATARRRPTPWSSRWPATWPPPSTAAAPLAG